MKSSITTILFLCVILLGSGCASQGNRISMDCDVYWASPAPTNLNYIVDTRIYAHTNGVRTLIAHEKPEIDPYTESGKYRIDPPYYQQPGEYDGWIYVDQHTPYKPSKVTVKVELEQPSEFAGKNVSGIFKIKDK